jgi:hypothetical protein
MSTNQRQDMKVYLTGKINITSTKEKGRINSFLELLCN